MGDLFVIVNGKRIKVINNELKLDGREIKDITKVQGLGELINLRKLWLNKNDITEIKGLEKLPNLQELYMRLNKLKSLKGLETLTNLQVLDLRDNQITEIKGLETLTNLQLLRLSKNQISEIKGLENLRNLRALFLSENKIKEIKGLDSLINLRELWMNKNQITEIKELDQLTKLEELYIRENKIQEIKGLTHLTKLQKLFLDRNEITEIKGLENLKSLQKLELTGNPIRGSEKAYLNKKISEILQLCLNKSKRGEIKRKQLKQKELYMKYYEPLLKYIVDHENLTLESLQASENFADINVKDLLIKILKKPHDITAFIHQNRTAVKFFLDSQFQEVIPEYRQSSKFKIYLQMFMNEFEEHEILEKVLFKEQIEEFFQFNSFEIFYLTNKRGIIIGKKDVIPEPPSLPGMSPSTSFSTPSILIEPIPIFVLDFSSIENSFNPYGRNFTT